MEVRIIKDGQEITTDEVQLSDKQKLEIQRIIE